MEFSPDQVTVFEKYLAGKNVFMTGPGGTGKTALIRQIHQDAYQKCLDVQVCALTGCAAVLLECKAKTVHSWAGIGLAKASIDDIVHKIIKNKPLIKATWKQTDLLIIDEVSMMSQKIFELLDRLGKTIRKNNKPFGGIQLLFSGDFYQLPPVGDRDEPETTKFCFESPRWFETFALDDHVSLRKIFRQTDPVYRRILNQIREGRLKRASHEALLQQVDKQLPPDCPLKPTKLYPTRNKVDYINTTEMGNLEGQVVEFALQYHMDLEITSNKDKHMRQCYTYEQIQHELMYLKGNLPCEETVKLKIGAQVMCIVNIQLSNGNILCNGAQGIVMEMDKHLGYPIVRFKNGYQMRMDPHVWPSETIPGVGVSQIPLILAWALTIHKSQGATLDVAEVDVGTGIFECGQTYVALSRVKSLEGLYLQSFDAKRIRIHKRVQEFYEKLEEHAAAKEVATKAMATEEAEAEAEVEAIEDLPEAAIVVTTYEENPIAMAYAVPIDFDQFAYTG